MRFRSTETVRWHLQEASGRHHSRLRSAGHTAGQTELPRPALLANHQM